MSVMPAFLPRIFGNLSYWMTITKVTRSITLFPLGGAWLINLQVQVVSRKEVELADFY